MGSHLWMREADSINHFCFGGFFLKAKNPADCPAMFCTKGAGYDTLAHGRGYCSWLKKCL